MLNWRLKYACSPSDLAYSVFPVLVGPHRMSDLTLLTLAREASRRGRGRGPPEYRRLASRMRHPPKQRSVRLVSPQSDAFETTYLSGLQSPMAA